MNQIQEKFNLYDHLAYILVGLYQIFVLGILYLLISSSSSNNLINLLRLEFSFTIILIAFLLGHLIQATSNIFEKWEKTKKEEESVFSSFIMKRSRIFFHLPKKIEDKDVWQYCYLYSLSNDFSGHIALFNSLHSLYRGFWIASFIAFIVSLLAMTLQIIVFITTKYKQYPDWRLGIYILATFGFSLLFNIRKKRFFVYLGKKVLIAFDILSKKNLTKKT